MSVAEADAVLMGEYQEDPDMIGYIYETSKPDGMKVEACPPPACDKPRFAWQYFRKVGCPVERDDRPDPKKYTSRVLT